MATSGRPVVGNTPFGLANTGYTWHTSNAIVMVKDRAIGGCGAGQMSRIDAANARGIVMVMTGRHHFKH